MGVQAAGYEKATRGRPDHSMAYYSLIKSEGKERPRSSGTRLLSTLGK